MVTAGPSTAIHWGGDVMYYHSLYPNKKSDYSEAILSLAEAEEMVHQNDITLKIVHIQVHACSKICSTTEEKFKANVKKKSCDDIFYIVVLKTEDETWWVLNIDSSLGKPAPGHLFLGKLDGYGQDWLSLGSVGSGVLAGTVSWLFKEDESNTSVEQLFRWLDQRYILEIQFEGEPGDSLLFCKELFDKVAKTKSWERLQGIAQLPFVSVGSGSKSIGQTKGQQWTNMIRFIHPDGKESFADEWLNELKRRVDPEGSVIAKSVRVYKVPLNEKFWTNLLMFHAYVVFQTKCLDTYISNWWSLEKNSQCIVLQKGDSEEKVRDWLGGEKRLESSRYWKPQLVCKDLCEEISLAEIIDLIHENDELGIKYHGTTENCQTFAQVIFDKLAETEKLHYGILPKFSTGLHRSWSGYKNPRPKNTN